VRAAAICFGWGRAWHDSLFGGRGSSVASLRRIDEQRHGATGSPLGGFCETRRHRAGSQTGHHSDMPMRAQQLPPFVTRRSTGVQRVSQSWSTWRHGAGGGTRAGGLSVKTDGDTQIDKVDKALAAYCRLRVFDASAISYPVKTSWFRGFVPTRQLVYPSRISLFFPANPSSFANPLRSFASTSPHVRPATTPTTHRHWTDKRSCLPSSTKPAPPSLLLHWLQS